MLALALLAVPLLPAYAQVGPPHECCYYNGTIYFTVVPPSAHPNEGRDPIYAFPEGGAEGQLPVSSVAPGVPGYHGGDWKVYLVTWNVDPYLLTSEADVLEAQAAGDVTVTRDGSRDFRCPLTGHR
jgi:hypothetical protein